LFKTEKDGTLLIVKQPQLATFAMEPYFYVSNSAVLFSAFVNGSTTGGSLYPRSELREMNGTEGAAWNTAKGNLFKFQLFFILFFLSGRGVKSNK
jgi:Alginate lyase